MRARQELLAHVVHHLRQEPGHEDDPELPGGLGCAQLPRRRVAGRRQEQHQGVPERRVDGPDGAAGGDGREPAQRAPDGRDARGDVDRVGHPGAGDSRCVGRRAHLPAAVCGRERARQPAAPRAPAEPDPRNGRASGAGRRRAGRVGAADHVARGRVHRYGGRGDGDDRDGGARPREPRDVHALRDPPVDDPRRVRVSHPVPAPQPVAAQHVPVGHGQAGHGRVRDQLHHPHGHDGQRAVLPAEAAVHDACARVHVVPRAAGRPERHCRHRVLFGLQPGGLGDHEPVGDRPRPLPFGLLPLVHGRREAQEPGRRQRDHREARRGRQGPTERHVRQARRRRACGAGHARVGRRHSRGQDGAHPAGRDRQQPDRPQVHAARQVDRAQPNAARHRRHGHGLGQAVRGHQDGQDARALDPRATDWRQVCVAPRAEGHVRHDVPDGGHAVHGRGPHARHHRQPARHPVAHDDRSPD
eukprot:Unigene5101_Nuclearia_a/m.15646 Unigene5101_Nuclearia_a/g.15646  ORF Unigene5101_Nuclearia_a/g.15646 Unigene5101_Nuclearia_a/m.15646 type:complete len:471 (+) Unigene5101_Nuclearia_a:355-1767(+)